MQQEPPKQIVTQQLKKFNFFTTETIKEKIDDPQSHPKKLTDITVSQICLLDQKIIFLDVVKNQVLVFGKCIQGFWSPHSKATLKISTSSPTKGVLVTYGQDHEGQRSTTYIRFWVIKQNQDYSKINFKKFILIGKIGEGQRIISCIHLMPDLSLLALGTTRGNLLIYQSRNLLDSDYKMSSKILTKRQINSVQCIRRGNQYDAYFTSQGAFFWLEGLSQKKRIGQQEVEVMEMTKRGILLISFKSNNKFIYEIKAGKEIRAFPIQGQKKTIKQFKQNYLVSLSFEKKNEKLEKSSQKYFLKIHDNLNQYIAFQDTYNKVEEVLVNDSVVIVIGNSINGQRFIQILTQKDNSFKIQTFFKRSFFNQAYRFAKNQNCQDSLLAQISRLHGDQLYSKFDYANSIKQYILTLGFVEPSYVIRKFLDVSQIDYLIQYLQKIHERKLAKKQHTALLLNCYVKKQKIDNLSQFLSESALQSDLFDIETAIKVCKDLKHIDEAMKLAEQKNKHKLYLKILIEDKKDYQKALEHIKTKVQMEEKEKYLIEFGQEFMKFLPKKTIQLIKLLIRVQSISQMIRGRERDITLNLQQKSVLEQLNYSTEELESLTVITFKKPDEFFRLFLINNQDLEDFLVYLVKEVQRLPNEQLVFHRLIQFYLEMMKESPDRAEQYEQKILENIQHTNKKPDNNHLLALFKMYDFDAGVVTLCKKLNMKDDLLNFYIERNRDQDILDLCKQHGVEEVNLWIHALKYFVKPEHKKQYYIPQILKSLSLIQNLPPLPILSILSKNKNIEYRFVKEFFLTKLKMDRKQIEKDKEVVKKNIKKAEQSRGQFKKIKTQAKPFLSNNCAQCQNNLTFPSIHFMCGHSFHQNCLGGDKECGKEGLDMRNIISRKQSLQMEAKNQTKFFQTLQEKRQTGFQVISEYLGKGLFSSLPKQ